MEAFLTSTQFIVGAVAGLVIGFLLGKVIGAAGKASQVRKNMGI
jgi:hypothetical protein